MAFRLGIELGNAAMSTPADVAEALGGVADRLRSLNGGTHWHGWPEGETIRDENGNTVGSWDVETDGLPGDGLAGEGDEPETSEDHEPEDAVLNPDAY